MDEWSNICSSFLFVDNTSVYRYNISKERSKIVMIIDELLKNEKISHYKLSKLSGVRKQRYQICVVESRIWGSVLLEHYTRLQKC